jgi:ElaB/YqjD/DUF883 family membrane-anchored ribosome-binding protein
MPTPDRSDEFVPNKTTTGAPGGVEATLVELRNDLATLVAEVKQVVETRSARAQEAAHVGLDATRDTIRSNPVASLAIATVIGAAAAMLLVPAKPTTRRLSQLREWTPAITPADLHDIVRNLQQAASRSTSGTPLMSVFERVVDSVSSIDPKASLAPALEKAGAWLNSLRGTVAGK